jgi:hypothetical protein
VVDWGPLPGDRDELEQRTDEALRAGGGWLRPEEVDEARMVGAWLAAHETRTLELDPRPAAARLAGFAFS